MEVNNIKNIIWVLLFPVFLLSCNNQKIFEQHKEFDKMSWNRFNILQFDVNVKDPESAYDILLAIRHLPEIRYKELKINMTIYSPSGAMRSADYILPMLDKDGNSISSCLGDLCDITIPIRNQFKFTEAGINRIEIENKFTKVDMPGIMEVGLIIKKST